MKRYLRIVLGILLVALGIVGLFLPILQGILFLVAGFLVLAPESPWIRRQLVKLKRKYPLIFSKAREWTKWNFSKRRKKKG